MNYHSIFKFIFSKNIFLFVLFLLENHIVALAQQPDTTNIVLECVDIIDPLARRKASSAQQIQMLYQRDIQFQNNGNTADLIANIGTISVQKSQQGGGSPILRGMEANRILLVVDGVRMNNLIYRGGHLQNIVTIDPNMLERIDILSGPSSTEYGSDALGGVIQVLTRKPNFSSTAKKLLFEGNAMARYGSASHEKTTHLDFTLGGKKIAALTSLTYSDFGDLRMGANYNPFYKKSFGERPFYQARINNKDSLVANANPLIQVASGYKQYDILEKIVFEPHNSSNSHTLNLQYSNSSDIPRYDRLTDVKGAGLGQAQWYYGPQKRAMASYGFKKSDFEKINQLTFGINYQNIEESRHSRGFGSKNLSHRIEKVQVVGYNLDVVKNISSSEFHLGFDGQYNRLNSTATKEDITTGTISPQNTRYPDGKNTMNNIAFYINGVNRVNKLTFNEGIRVGYSTLHSTFVDKTFFPFPFSEVQQKNLTYSGNVGMVYQSRDWSLRSLVSSGFRVPNVDDLSKVFETAGNNIIVPNPNLKPEKSLNFDLNLDVRLAENRVYWENRIYATRLFDALIVAPFLFEGKDTIVYNKLKSRVLASQNQQNARILGFISEIRVILTRTLTLKGAASYTSGRFLKEGITTPMDHIPPFGGRLGLTYQTQKLNTELYSVFNAWKRLSNYYLNAEDNEAYATPDGMPAWITLNWKASYALNNIFTLQLGIENIFDTQYRTFASGINASGRNVFGVVRARF